MLDDKKRIRLCDLHHPPLLNADRSYYCNPPSHFDAYSLQHSPVSLASAGSYKHSDPLATPRWLRVQGVRFHVDIFVCSRPDLSSCSIRSCIGRQVLTLLAIVVLFIIYSLFFSLIEFYSLVRRPSLDDPARCRTVTATSDWQIAYMQHTLVRTPVVNKMHDKEGL